MKTNHWLLLILVAVGHFSLADSLSFQNSDFRMDGSSIQYLGSPDNLGIKNISPTSETYPSKVADPTADGFFHVHLDKENGHAARSYEFTQSSSGLKAGTIKFDDKGAPIAATACDSWSGCVTVTNRLCKALNQSLHANPGTGVETAKDIQKCANSLRNIFTTENFQSPSYKDLSKKEYDSLYDYRAKNKLGRTTEFSMTWLDSVDRFFSSDPGRTTYQQLHGNGSAEISEKPYTYSNAVMNVAKLFSTCEKYGDKLAKGPSEWDPNRRHIQFNLGDPKTTKELKNEDEE